MNELAMTTETNRILLQLRTTSPLTQAPTPSAGAVSTPNAPIRRALTEYTDEAIRNDTLRRRREALAAKNAGGSSGAGPTTTGLLSALIIALLLGQALCVEVNGRVAPSEIGLPDKGASADEVRDKLSEFARRPDTPEHVFIEYFWDAGDDEDDFHPTAVTSDSKKEKKSIRPLIRSLRLSGGRRRRSSKISEDVSTYARLWMRESKCTITITTNTDA